MAIQERLYTVEEFLDIANLPENADKRLELDEGVIVEMPPSSQKNTVIAGIIIYLLNMFVIPNKLGYVTTPDGGFKLTEYSVRQPDVAFISKARHSELKGVAFPLAPDLAIEVISPGEDPVPKMRQYFAAGTREVWSVYPETETIFVWHQVPDGGLHGQEYNVTATIDGGDVLPGFSLRVADVFPK